MMAIKLVALDFDRVITPSDSPALVLNLLGEEETAEELVSKYYSGMARAKSAEARDLVVRRLKAMEAEALQRHDYPEVERASRKIPLERGASGLFKFLRNRGIMTAIFTATTDAIMIPFLTHSRLYPDFLESSRTKVSGKKLLKQYFVLTPLRKRQELSKLLKRLHLKPSECLVVGDSLSEEYVFRLVGRKNSVAFNYNPNIKKFCATALFERGKEEPDLMAIAKVVQSFE